jgi:lipoate-protein ligase A
VFQGLQDYMTTMRDELGVVPDRRMVVDLYRQKLAEVLGAKLVPGEWTEAEEARARELDRTLGSAEWLEQKGASRRPGVKIHEDVQVHESSLKAPGGLIRLTLRLRGGRIDDISLSGDFTIFPRSAVTEIEESLRGTTAEPQAVLAVIREKYRKGNIQSPGIGPDDWAAAFSLTLKSWSAT